MSIEPSNVVSLVHVGALALACAALLWAAVSDARQFRIPNMVSLVLLALFPVYVVTAPTEVLWLWNVVVFLVILGIGFFMFWHNYVGAGDVKLMATSALWAGPEALGAFLLVTALAGALLGIGIAGATWHRHRALSAKEQVAVLRKTPIPYGIAIAVGGIAALMQLASPLFSPV